ncbi:MAG: hypothetical protein ACK5NQ_01275 [Pseudomonas sp.]
MKISLGGKAVLGVPDGVLAFFGALIILLFSLCVYPYFYGGDQLYYREFYEGVSGLSLVDAFAFYRETLGTSEPIYFLVVYFFSSFVSKDVLFSLLNFVLAYLVLFWMLVNRVKILIIFLLVFNFYFVVLLFSAERLKVSLILFLLGLVCHGSCRFVLFGVSFFAHVQVLMLFIAAESERIVFMIQRLLRGKILFEALYLFLGVCVICSVVFLMRAHVVSKLSYYLELGGWVSVIKPLALCCAAVFYARGCRLQAVLSGAPFLIFAFFVGDERVTIFSYFVFMYFALRFNGGSNLGVVLFGLYFLWSGLRFLYAIFESGDGFDAFVLVPEAGLSRFS